MPNYRPGAKKGKAGIRDGLNEMAPPPVPLGLAKRKSSHERRENLGKRKYLSKREGAGVLEV